MADHARHHADVTITLFWDESFPGWSGIARATVTTEHVDGRVGIRDLEIKADPEFRVRPFGCSTLLLDHLVDNIAREINVHPDNLGQIHVVVDTDQLRDVAKRMQQ